MLDGELISLAEEARSRAYAPYSCFAVGAALLAKDGRVFTGCNLENVSYSATVCAERVAFGTAIAAGCREFEKIAIVGGRAGEPLNRFCMPCGICRQVMYELCAPDFEILSWNGTEARSFRLDALLPSAFEQED